MELLIRLGMGWLLVLGMTGPASGTPLGLTLFDNPDIVSMFIDVVYDAGTDTFEADGFALGLDDDGVGPTLDIVGGSFDLTATIDGAGLLTGGSLVIGGTVANLGFNSGTLLTGSLTDFGFPGVPVRRDRR